MRVSAVAAILAMLAGNSLAQVRDPVIQVFKAQAEVEKKLVAANLAEMERVQDQLRAAGDRLMRLGDDLLRAERDGEDAASFASRVADLRRAEAEMTQAIATAQQLRSTLAARRGTLEQLQTEIARLEAGGKSSDEVSGRWQVAIEPGGLKGTFDLELSGTIVTGVYSLAGGWKGSLRGTLIGQNLRLERIDAQLGFVAVYTGRVVTRGDEKRLEGRWDATNLVAGGAVSGTWLARRDAAP